jgi:hypothetical protein
MPEQFYMELLINLICLWIGFRLGSGSDAFLKRKRFRSYIELLRRKIESTQANRFVHDFTFAIRDVPKFEIEVLEIRSQIETNILADLMTLAPLTKPLALQGSVIMKK